MNITSDALTVILEGEDGVPLSEDAWTAVQQRAQDRGCSAERAAIEVLIEDHEKE